MGNCNSGLETIPIPGIDGNLDESSKELLLKALNSKENGDEIIKTLIASNVDLNHKLEYEAIGSCYPLHIASKIGNVNAVDLLLEGGANNSLTDSQGRTPLHWAVSEEHLDVVDRLIESHADVNVFAEEDITPLYLAIKTNNEDLVKKLLAAGANVSPEKGENPLITSVKGDHVKVIMPLLMANASPVGLNFDLPEGGPTCLQSWASANGHDEIAAFLKEKFPEEGAVSEMEKEIKEENEQREGGDGAEDISTHEEVRLSEQPPEDSKPESTNHDHLPEESVTGSPSEEINETSPKLDSTTEPDVMSPEPGTSRDPTPEKTEEPPAASENDSTREESPGTEQEKEEENKICDNPDQSKDTSDNEDNKISTDV
ncbi:UNVERIFIED_CONTAM: hypothetical protein RMT77_012694 [Armadillidium vulgare]